jgi:hypothetical protein
LAFIHVQKEKRKKLDYRVSPAIVGGYSILTKQYFVYDPLARTLHCSQDVVFREGKQYSAPNATDEVILIEHFYRDIIQEPKPAEKQPTRDEKSEGHLEEPLDDESHPKPKQKSRELAGDQTALR